MELARREINHILSDLPCFRFTFPDMRKIRRLDAENSRKRKEVQEAGKSISVLNKTNVEALAAINPDALKELQKRIGEALSEHQ
jgi:hypothetical protein